ncbi:hypothetical protein [Magnetospirillum sp. SS-4]|uniref:hypothetical protein n=1 Tax=Magnetospirillum sp. SS-4 TaxID=2681465 RepID=UPI00137FEF96|nr:hypothetical protein [Magnetospirillum sp. SS-4]CAA7624944.1 conserved hypothetical protein [Magnetospirillum sp. SS-4]
MLKNDGPVRIDTPRRRHLRYHRRMIGWLQRLFLDKRARDALTRRTAAPLAARHRRNPAATGTPPPPPERDAATALAEAEARMRRLPPEKAQLIRSALLVHRARQSALGELSDDERARLRQVAQKALLGGGG